MRTQLFSVLNVQMAAADDDHPGGSLLFILFDALGMLWYGLYANEASIMKTSSAHVLNQEGNTKMSAVAKKSSAPTRKLACRTDLEALVNAEDGTRVHLDLEGNLFEVVQITGLNRRSCSADSCAYVRDCTEEEVHLLRKAIAQHWIMRVPCKTWRDGKPIVLPIAFMT